MRSRCSAAEIRLSSPNAAAREDGPVVRAIHFLARGQNGRHVWAKESAGLEVQNR